MDNSVVIAMGRGDVWGLTGNVKKYNKDLKKKDFISS